MSRVKLCIKKQPPPAPPFLVPEDRSRGAALADVTSCFVWFRVDLNLHGDVGGTHQCFLPANFSLPWLEARELGVGKSITVTMGK